jgi:penicillin-binding protein 1A
MSGEQAAKVVRQAFEAKGAARVALGALATLLFAMAVHAWSTCGGGGCPDVRALAAQKRGGASLIVDRNGETIASLARTQPRVVSLASVPASLRHAILAVEDKRFYAHEGIDWIRVAGALRANLRAGRFEQGFSTITMQVARTLFPDRIPGRSRTLSRKLLEVRVACEIERRFSKDEILELYLNYVSFGRGAPGIEAASLLYFDHSAASLTLNESALLAALPKGPSHYDPRAHPEAARARRDLILRLMERQQRVAPELAQAARAEPLPVAAAPPPRATDPAGTGYFADAVRARLEPVLGDALYAQPVKVWTTLDLRAQRAAVAALSAQLGAIEGGKLGRFTGERYRPGPRGRGAAYLQGALVMLDVETGDVLAWVGGRDYEHSQFDRVAGASRLAGSAFKPFVYAAAFSRGYALSQPLLDEPLAVQLPDGRVWEPRNLGDSYVGQVSVRRALVESKNVPTVRLAMAIGRSQVAALARRAGLGEVSLEPSMALGAVEVSPLDLTAAYTAFASGGARAAPRLVLRVETLDGRLLWSSTPSRSAVVDAGVAFLVTDALRGALEYGSGARIRSAGFRGAAAGKTGTTNDSTDVWFVGYTPRVAAGVWIGFDDPRPIIPGAIAGRLAAPAWGRLMAAVHGAKGEKRPWPAPPGIVVRRVDRWSGLVVPEGCDTWDDLSYSEFFLSGWEPAPFCPGRDDPPLRGFWTEGRVNQALSGPTPGARAAPAAAWTSSRP